MIKTLQIVGRILFFVCITLFAIGLIPGLFILWLPAIILGIACLLIAYIIEQLNK